MLELDDVATVIAGAVREATAPLIEQNAALEARLAALAGSLPAFDDSELLERLAAVEAREPLKGEPGEVDMQAVRQIVDEMTQQAVSEQLTEAVKAIPVPEASEPIAPDMKAIGEMIREGIAEAIKSIPTPKNGEPGVGLASGLIDRDGALVLTLSDGKTLNLGQVVGKDGDPGKTFTLDDFDIVQYPDRRTFKFCFTRGEVMHSFEFALPTPIYRGVFKDGGAYEIGDMVTWAGSMWHCDKDTSEKPGASDAWSLAVKKGQNGKDAQ